MGVDQTRIAPEMTAVQHRVGLLGQVRSQRPDEAVLAVEIDSGQHPVLRITGDDALQVFYQ